MTKIYSKDQMPLTIRQKIVEFFNSRGFKMSLVIILTIILLNVFPLTSMCIAAIVGFKLLTAFGIGWIVNISILVIYIASAAIYDLIDGE